MNVVESELRRAQLHEVIAKLKEVPAPASIQLLHFDHQLERLVGVWPLMSPMCYRTSKAPEMGPPDSVVAMRNWLWGNYKDDPGKIAVSARRLLGPLFPITSKLAQARENLMVYPDMTIHPTAQRYISAKSTQIIKRMVGNPTQGGSSQGGGGRRKDK